MEIFAKAYFKFVDVNGFKPIPINMTGFLFLITGALSTLSDT